MTSGVFGRVELEPQRLVPEGMRSSPPSSPREPSVRTAVAKLSSELDRYEGLTEKLRSVFSPVVISSPMAERGTGNAPSPPVCDLGASLLMLAERLNEASRSVEDLIESADL